jgi:Ca2+-binding RTX toxin-like protein
MVYDVTDPANASFVSYKPQTAQDLGPETSAFVSAANSPTGQALLLSGQEISNSVTLYSIQTQTEGDDTIKGGADGETWNGRGGNDSIAGNGGNDNITGGAGTDTAVFRGVRAGYLVTNNGTVVTDINLVDGDDGTDTLSTVEFLAFSDQTVSTQSFVTYQLQLLHLSDGEAGLLAPTTAPLLAALFDRFEDQVANSITIAGGDTYIPGPFLAGGTDPSLSPVLNAVAGTTFAAGALAPIAAVDTAIHNIIGVEVSGIGNHEWDLGSNVYQASITPGTSNTNPGWVGANYVSLTANLNFNPGGGISADAINGRFTIRAKF